MKITPDAGRPHSVAVLAYDGLCLFEFSAALEALSAWPAAEGRGGYAPFPVSVEGANPSTDLGVRLTLTADTEALETAQTIVVPGWRMGPTPQGICDLLVAAHARGARIASICTGAFVLADAGLLDGRRATTHWRYADGLRERHPSVTVDAGVLYVDDGDILTSAGSSAGVDMLLHMIRSDFGSAACNHVARMMVAPPHREGGQAQYIEAPVQAPGRTRFSSVLEQLRRDPAAEHTIEGLALQAAMSPRTFFRKFRATTGHTPYDWVLMERARLAREMLETTDLSVDRIAEQTGFGAPDTFRHHFRRLVGVTPSQFRKAFRQGAAA